MISEEESEKSGKKAKDGGVMNSKKSVLGAILGFLLSSGSTGIAAQDSGGQSITSGKGRTLEEIIVTARKREETLQAVPVAVSVLSETVIKAERIASMVDIATSTPGLVVGDSTSATAGNINLRGIGTGGATPLVDQAVAINIDNIGINSAQLLNAAMYDLRQVEVLRGPQALFFGKNSPGGVVVIHTKDPGDEFEFELTGEYETEAEQTVGRAIFSGPLTDTFGARLALSWSDEDGNVDIVGRDAFATGPDGTVYQTAYKPVEDTALVKEDKSAILTLLWKPIEQFSAKLKYMHVEQDITGSQFTKGQRTTCSQGAPQVKYPVSGVNECSKDGVSVQPGLIPDLIALNNTHPNYGGGQGGLMGFRDNEHDFASLEMNYDLDNNLSLTSVTGWYKNREDRYGDASFQAHGGLHSSSWFDIKQLTQEIRLASNYDGRFNFMVGAFYEDKEISAMADTQISSLIVGVPVETSGFFGIDLGRQIGNQDGTSWSLFSQFSFDITDRLTLTAGARYSYEEKEGKILVDGAPAAYGPAINIPLLKDDPDWNNVSPEVSLSYQWTDDLMLFANYKTGFKSGGFDSGFKAGALAAQAAAGIPYDNIFDEEDIDGFEVGMKSTWLDGTLRFNVTAFSYDYEDMQISKFAGGQGAQAISLRVINAAKASIDGVDIETTWATPVDGLTLSADVEMLKAEYDDYLADCFVGQTIAMGCDQTLNPATGRFTQANMSGESLPNAADLSANLRLEYDTPIGANWNMRFNASAAYTDQYNPTSEKYPDSWTQDSFWLTNAAATLYSSDDRWEFYIKGTNLGDEWYAAYGTNLPFSGNGTYTGTDNPAGLADFLSLVMGGRKVTLGFTYRM